MVNQIVCNKIVASPHRQSHGRLQAMRIRAKAKHIRRAETYHKRACEDRGCRETYRELKIYKKSDKVLHAATYLRRPAFGKNLDRTSRRCSCLPLARQSD